MQTLLISACLLGVNCKYSGGNNRCGAAEALGKRFHLVPVCPEQLGGLPTPRTPAERQGERVLSREGTDVTAQYRRGAEETLALAKRLGCKTAVLKARSPSCGCRGIYDGTFTGTLVSGMGVTAELLVQSGIRVLSEEDLQNSPDFS